MGIGFIIGLCLGLIIGFAIVGIMLFSFQYWGVSWIFHILNDDFTGIMWNEKDKKNFIKYYKKKYGKDPYE